MNIFHPGYCMGGSRQGRSREETKLSSVDPASRPLAWKVRAFEGAARLACALETSRDQHESVGIMLQVIEDSLGVGCHAAYLDEKGNGELRLLHGRKVEPGTLPGSLTAGSSFVAWLGRSSSPEMMESFFRSSGELTGSELNIQDAFVRAGTGSACALKFGGEIIGIYVFASGKGEDYRIEDLHAAIGLMASITAAAVANQLISDESVHGAEARERAREIEFRAVRNAVLEKTAADLQTSLGVLKSGLWSIDPEPDSGSVMIDMARDAAVSLGARVRELVSLSNIEPAGQDIEIEEVDPADIIEDVTREMIADFERKSLTLSVEDRSGGRKLRIDPGKLAYVLRSVMENILHSAERGSAVEIVSAFVNEGPDGGDGPWFVLRMSGGAGAGSDDAIEAMLDSLASAQDHAAGPPADSGLTLSEYILESRGGRLVADDEDADDISVWLPVGY